MKYPGGSYVVVRDMSEGRQVCDYIEGRGDRETFLMKFAKAASPGFDPDVHLRRIGVANQTTMLAKESLAIGAEVGDAIARARGPEARATDFRTFDTICSATQERQDAVIDLLEEPLTAMVVIGGFNSSNTISLAALCAERVPTYHIEDASGIDPDAGTVHYRRRTPVGCPRQARCASGSRRAPARRTTRSGRPWRAFSPRAVWCCRSAERRDESVRVLRGAWRLDVDRSVSCARCG
jgi:4-hydroxy-3-methylbut-2-enyl diphosphate reductase